MTAWPKPASDLTPEEERIQDDWQQYWHEINRTKYSAVTEFGHRYVVSRRPPGRVRTLEIGPGLGEHLNYEKPGDGEWGDYTAVELRENMAAELRKAWPKLDVAVGDCQAQLPFAPGSIDRIVAIHVLEHLRNLPGFLREARRLLKREGRLVAVLPCEGGLGYALGRRVSSQYHFEKRYRRPYGRFIRAEHPNTLAEVLEALREQFDTVHSEWWPLKVPSIHMNLCVGLDLAPRA